MFIQGSNRCNVVCSGGDLYAITFDTTSAACAWRRMALEMMTNPYGDAEFQTNAISFRAGERIAIGVIRPTAINVVTGLEAA